MLVIRRRCQFVGGAKRKSFAGKSGTPVPPTKRIAMAGHELRQVVPKRAKQNSKILERQRVLSARVASDATKLRPRE
jgi:cell division septum initiation protein DivIVA